MRTLAVFALLSLLGCSKREALASIDLRGAPAEKAIDASAGDSLRFAAAAVVDLSSLPGSAREREHAARSALRRTKLTVTVTGPSGEQTVSCPIYDGNASSTSVNSSVMRSTGMTNTCAVTLPTAGTHTIKASASFDPLLVVHAAHVDIERATAK